MTLKCKKMAHWSHISPTNVCNKIGIAVADRWTHP